MPLMPPCHVSLRHYVTLMMKMICQEARVIYAARLRHCRPLRRCSHFLAVKIGRRLLRHAWLRLHYADSFRFATCHYELRYAKMPIQPMI